MSADGLKLRAADAEDVQVLSAVMQDSIVPVCDMAFLPDENKFMLVAQRLRRENDPSAPERICCALTAAGVSHVRTQGLDLCQQDRILDLLAILAEPGGVRLVFAGDAQIRIDMPQLSVTIADFGDAWPTVRAPCHEAV